MKILKICLAICSMALVLACNSTPEPSKEVEIPEHRSTDNKTIAQATAKLKFGNLVEGAAATATMEVFHAGKSEIVDLGEVLDPAELSLEKCKKIKAPVNTIIAYSELEASGGSYILHAYAQEDFEIIDYRLQLSFEEYDEIENGVPDLSGIEWRKGKVVHNLN